MRAFWFRPLFSTDTATQNSKIVHIPADSVVTECQLFLASSSRPVLAEIDVFPKGLNDSAIALTDGWIRGSSRLPASEGLHWSGEVHVAAPLPEVRGIIRNDSGATVIAQISVSGYEP